MIRRLMPDIIDDQEVFQLAGTATVREAVQGMAARDVNSVLIAEDGQLLGIFTGTDLVKKVVAPSLDPDTTALAEVMTKDPQTVGPDMGAIEALHLMQDGRYRHLPIVENDKILGVMSRRDFLGFEIEELEHQDDLWQKL